MNQDLRSKLDRIMRLIQDAGDLGPLTQIDQLAHLIFLKVLDEEEEYPAGNDSGGARIPLFPDQASRFRWRNWVSREGDELREFLSEEVFPYMASLVGEERQVAEFFRDSDLRIADACLLQRLVHEIDSIEFRILCCSTRGMVFEYILQRLGERALVGEFRTPGHIRALMVAMLNPRLGETVLDPACGTGGFLVDCVKFVLANRRSGSPQLHDCVGDGPDRLSLGPGEVRKEPSLEQRESRRRSDCALPERVLLQRSIHGIEIYRPVLRFAILNLALHDVRGADLKWGSALSESGAMAGAELRNRFDVVLSAPPSFRADVWEPIRQDLYRSVRSRLNELLFLSQMMDALAPGGRCAAVFPDHLLSRTSAAHTRIRRVLIEEFHVLAVVSLPVETYGSEVRNKVSVLVFQRLPEEEENATRPTWFYEVPQDFFSTSGAPGEGQPARVNRDGIADLMAKWEEFRGTRFRHAPGVDAGAESFGAATPENCWWVDSDALRDSDCILAAGYWRPQIAARAPIEDPGELIRDLLGLEAEIHEVLERLRAEIETTPESEIREGSPYQPAEQRSRRDAG